MCLMDEPLSNLDAQLRGEMRREIRALQQRLGITMVYVTHDQTEAMTMADRVVLLRDGRIEQVGSPEELYARPATAFTASFIGAPPMNLMRLDGAAVLTGVRPEDMRIATDGLAAQVESVEYLGADSLVATQRRRGSPCWCGCRARAERARVTRCGSHGTRRTSTISIHKPEEETMKQSLETRSGGVRRGRARRDSGRMSRSRSTTRSPSADRSPRPSTRWPPISRRRTPASR